jgi:hypothetical protein
MENHITSKCVWYEVCGVFEREWTDDVPLSFRMGKKDNDREINEWYNEVKLGRQIGICGGDIVCWIVKG